MGVIKKKPPKDKFPKKGQIFPAATQRWPTFNVESDQLVDLVAWWPNGSQGYSKLLDVIGGFDMPFAGASTDPVWVNDKEFGPVLDFETSSSQRLTLEQAVLVGADRPLSITSWWKEESATNTIVVSLANSASTKNYYHLAKLNAVERFNNNNYSVAHTGTVVTGKWHHTAGVFKDNNERFCYLDGGNKGTSTFITDPPSGINRTTIGYLGDSSPSNYHDGLIGDSRIYNRVLSDAEVEAQWHPDTRFELYEVPGRIYFVSGLTQTLAGDLLFTGTATKQTATTEAGALTFVGTLAKKTAATALAGALTFVGAVGTDFVFAQALAGALTFAGTLTRKTSTGVAGALTFAGTVAKKTSTSVAGALTFAGAASTGLIFIQALAGALTFTGTLTKQTAKILAGALTFVGALTARSKVTYKINAGAKVHGVQSSWKRIAKRTNSDGKIDFSDWAINTWSVSVMTMTTFETLRAQQGQTLTTLETNNIDDINFGKSYGSAFIEGVVNGPYTGKLVMSVKITFRVDITS